MIKYISLLIIAVLMLGCGSRPKVETAEVQNVVKKTKTVTEAPTLPAGFKEKTKLRVIGANIPTTCQEWSDGCNTCSRAKNNQASCTIYTCENKGSFSCLKWQ